MLPPSSPAFPESLSNLPPGGTGQDPLQEAQKLAEVGDYRQAMQLLDQNRQLENTSAYWVTRASIQVKIGHYGQARHGLLKALELEPNSPSAQRLNTLLQDLPNPPDQTVRQRN